VSWAEYLCQSGHLLCYSCCYHVWHPLWHALPHLAMSGLVTLYL
jgi:hypothetical protein